MAEQSLRVIPFVITCDASGDASVTQAEPMVNGYLWEVMYVPGTIATGGDVTLSVVNTVVTKTILTMTDAGTATLIKYPRGNACGATGTVGTDGIQLIPVVGKLKVVVAQGGNAGAGTLYVTVME
jgi:hypothetical protein